MLGVEDLAYLAADDEELYEEIINTVGNLCLKVVERVLALGLTFDFGHFWEDKKNSLNITKQTVKGGFKFTFYKEGKKKPIKTIKVKTNKENGIVKLPKGKGTYYIKVSKLTKKTSGYYSIVDWN